MPVASVVSKRTYIGKEVTPGTLVAANKFLEGMNIRIMPNQTRGEVRPSGSTMRTQRPLVQNWTTFELVDGSYLDFNGALYFLSMLGNPTTTIPAGGTITQHHAFAYASDGLNTRPTFTMVSGYRGGSAERVTRATFQSIGFGFSRTAAPTITGSGFAQEPDFTAAVGVNEVWTLTPTPAGSITAGTFTIIAGGGTASIVFNATNGSIDTALEAQSGIGSGAVVVTGGTLPALPVVITFSGGTLANYNVPAPTISSAGLTGGSIVYAETQAGGITTVPVQAIQAPDWSVYMDNASGGTIGTTKVRPYSAEFAFNGLTNPDWIVDQAEGSWEDEVLQVPELTLNMVMRNSSAVADGAPRTIAQNLINGDTYLARFEAIGPLTGEGTLRYLLRMDFAVQASENVMQFGDEGGSETIPMPMTIVSDADNLSGGFTAVLRNIIASM